jgi:hypothetical protein
MMFITETKPMKYEKITLKIKKDKEAVDIWYATVGYFTCPHCKKVVILSDKKAVEHLKKWKKQKPTK